MKVELEKYISDIFSALQITENFEVLDCKNDLMPEWINQRSLTHEFLIYCSQLSKKEKLKSFLRKEIFQYKNFSYWFEGESLIEENQYLEKSSNVLDNIANTEVDFLKTETRLPQWLDKYIFNDLKAEYAPNFQRFEYNLDLNEDDNLKYLGTYFPRSYAESFCIFDNIFQNKQYQKLLFPKKCLNILSVGCGTGGDLIGLITVIEKYYPVISKIDIWALDGNKNALSILTEVIEKFSIQYSININVRTIESVFDSISQIEIPQISGYTFDFILSFKMICEIISAGKGCRDDSYYDFVVKFAPMLSENGLCVLLDVTTKTDHNNTYNPILKNRQVNQALRKLKNYQTLLPLPCSKNETTCTEECFTQQKFYVSHMNKINDVSKVSYRVIAKTNLVNTILDISKPAKYVLQRNGKNIEKLCPYSCGEEIIDGYKL